MSLYLYDRSSGISILCWSFTGINFKLLNVQGKVGDKNTLKSLICLPRFTSENTWTVFHPRRMKKNIATQLIRWVKEITVAHYLATYVLCYANINRTYINIKWTKQISTLQLDYKKGAQKGSRPFPLNISLIWIN